MKVKYDKEVDAAYIQLSSKHPDGGIEITGFRIECGMTYLFMNLIPRRSVEGSSFENCLNHTPHFARASYDKMVKYPIQRKDYGRQGLFSWCRPR